MIRRRIVQLKELTHEDWSHLLAALLLLPLVGLSLTLQGFNKTHSLMARMANPTPGTGSPRVLEMQIVRQVVRMVSAAANHGPFRANCLQRSLLTWWLLERKGLSVCLRIGTRKNEQELQAHAWVEYAGEVLNDRQNIADQFVPFDAALVPARLHII